jgi:hypothetical protein
MRSPIFQSLPPIMGETITAAALFEVHASVGPQLRKPGGSRYFFRE